ncbi:hypothetical protein GGS23DRAFT_228445 [Durotheca rogersii]|uniref:uncharacterized protein n=1 Tax=Durotheca rogersii TaxID=419775 RepID=UPI0022205867|nr:uncharacterized protein GGS23DRAFT_228445 [Durotheca rogersii]KAI5860551.1 hypothetical protein GGS23DRAFT_228445 [Durotheca rogersii]
MRISRVSTLASLAPVAAAIKSETTFAVLHFTGKQFLTEGPMDPVVNPGEQATHYHSIMGGSNFGINTRGDDLLSSECTTTTIKRDFSNYWVPTLFFQDPENPSSFEKVPLFYMNVYYFFEASNSTVEPFPVGLKMLSGDSSLRDPPAFGGGRNLDPTKGPIQPVQWTCPRQSYDPPSYPADSDGTTAGLQDPGNAGAGAGFPLYNCDGTYSPLRQDIHFPSCYNPAAGIDDYQNNMAWPTAGAGGLLECPAGWLHVPHLFYEVYWDTPAFADRWTPDGKTQPFVLSNGDATGYSSHADFISGWEPDTLAAIIGSCNVGTIGMENCPDIPGGVNDNHDCTIPPAIGSIVPASESLSALPLNLPVTGWGRGSSADYPSKVAVPVPGSGSGSGSASSASSPEASPEATAPGNAFIQLPTSQASEAAAAATPSPSPAVSAAAVVPAPAPVVDEADTEVDEEVSTVWDIVTVTVTTTVVADATPAPARRRAPAHGHGHVRRHGLGAGRR